MATNPPRVDADLIARLRADLVAAGFTVAGVTTLLGPMAAAALDREQPLPARRAALASPGPAATLVRLFTLGDPVDLADVEDAFPTLRGEGLIDLGLVRQEGDGVVALCDLRPYATDGTDHWLAADLGELALGRPLAPDHVLGIGGASATLASWTPRTHVERALDLGTGCGIQALHLSRHADRVTATDLSHRALAFARFNAALNGLEWDIRSGSLLEPVAGQRFHLIVSNPPFVITPRTGEIPLFEYRDGGVAGDAVVAGLVRSVGAHLEPGGVAQLLGNWEVPAGADWRDRVGEWVRATGLDAWVVQREVQDPAQYAEVWARDGGHHNGTSEFATMYAAWLDDFASRDVEAVGFGVITLQRPTSGRSPFVDLMEAPGPVAHPMGPGVEAGLAARTLLAESSDSDLLSRRWRVADDVTEARWSRPGATDPAVIELVQGGGLRRTVRLSTAAAAYVSVADGELTADQALVAIAALLDADADSVRAEVLPVIRDAAKDGLLVL